MINGDIKYLSDYKGLNKDLAVAIDYLLNNDLEKLPVGLTTVNDKITVTKLVYIGKNEDEAFPEEHKHHLDMQIVLHGREKCYFDYLVDDDFNHIYKEYNEEKDVIKFDKKLRHYVIMDNRNFTMFYPSDVHKPSIKIDDNQITKLVIKILL